MKRALLSIIVGALYLLHQDFWFWRAAHPLVFGFIPVGLFYHACYTLVTAVVVWLLVKHAWPYELEEQAGDEAALRTSDRPISASPNRSVSSGEGAES